MLLSSICVVGGLKGYFPPLSSFPFFSFRTSRLRGDERIMDMSRGKGISAIFLLPVSLSLLRAGLMTRPGGLMDLYMIGIGCGLRAASECGGIVSEGREEDRIVYEDE